MKKFYQIFTIISICFLLFLAVFYSYRFVHYYQLSRKQVVPKIELFADLLKEKEKDSLALVEEAAYYQSATSNNYVSFSGYLWRVVSIMDDGTIKIVLNEPIQTMVWGYAQNQYSNSYIDLFLNQTEEPYTGFFEKTLQTDYLTKAEWCMNSFENFEKTACVKTKLDHYIGLLSVYDYQNTGGADGFLKQDYHEWLMNATEEGNAWIRKEDGTLSNLSHVGDSYYHYAVRPVVVLKAGLKDVAGDGSPTNPYVISKISSKKLQDQSIGSFVVYQDRQWRIVDRGSFGTQLVSVSPIKENDDWMEHAFDRYNNVYDPDSWGSVGYYLNRTFLNTLPSEDLVLFDYPSGSYGLEQKYNYRSVFDSHVSTKVGLLSIASFKFLDLMPSFLITPSSESEETIYLLKEKGILYEEQYDQKYSVCPSIVLVPNFEVTSGNGSKEAPFQLKKV